MPPTQPGRGSDQFPLRLPDGMRDRLKESAAGNGRSMNAEIVARLEESFDADSKITAVNSASRLVEQMRNEVSEQLAYYAQLIEKQETLQKRLDAIEKNLSEKRADYRKRELDLKRQREALQAERASLREDVEKSVREELERRNAKQIERLTSLEKRLEEKAIQAEAREKELFAAIHALSGKKA